jgi:hypothetical protein
MRWSSTSTVCQQCSGTEEEGDDEVETAVRVRRGTGTRLKASTAEMLSKKGVYRVSSSAIHFEKQARPRHRKGASVLRIAASAHTD